MRIRLQRQQTVNQSQSNFIVLKLLLQNCVVSLSVIKISPLGSITYQRIQISCYTVFIMKLYLMKSNCRVLDQCPALLPYFCVMLLEDLFSKIKWVCHQLGHCWSICSPPAAPAADWKLIKRELECSFVAPLRPWAVLHSCTTVTGSIQGYRFACRQPLPPLPHPLHFTVKLPNQNSSWIPPTHLLPVLLNSRTAVIGQPSPHSLLCVIIPTRLTLHSALFGTWAARQAGRLLSFSSLSPILHILDTASIPAVFTRPTGRHDSEARLRASGGDVTPAHHQRGTHHQLRSPKKF